MTSTNTASAAVNDSTILNDLSVSVNEVVRRFPDSLPVFAAYGLDTCCRGNMSVSDAAADAGVDPVVLVEALRETIRCKSPVIVSGCGCS